MIEAGIYGLYRGNNMGEGGDERSGASAMSPLVKGATERSDTLERW